MESGRCVPGPNRTGPDSPRGIINQNIYAQGRASVRRVAPTLRLIDYPMSRSIRYFQGVLYGCPLVLAQREKDIKRVKKVRLVRRRSRRRASRSLVIYTSQRVNVHAFFILPSSPPPHLAIRGADGGPSSSFSIPRRSYRDARTGETSLWTRWRATLLGAS